MGFEEAMALGSEAIFSAKGDEGGQRKMVRMMSLHDCEGTAAEAPISATCLAILPHGLPSLNLSPTTCSDMPVLAGTEIKKYIHARYQSPVRLPHIPLLTFPPLTFLSSVPGGCRSSSPPPQNGLLCVNPVTTLSLAPPAFPSSFLSKSSLDLTLGDEFRFFVHHNGTVAIDDQAGPEEYKDLTRKIKLKNGESYMLGPGQMCLGITRERVHLPNDLCALVGMNYTRQASTLFLAVSQ
ncbi:hypothetical protein BC936DRAFT_136736 [Jimgerdemannia flammicorona]|uniref:Uncharacterized protein n=1 Tax=Jimgerdemannia flammicorona TaxID=994334 RepID=A0A433CYY0_9FUNG|nr:hypothetical protein BC936DRAFT_136736 [Jimgerdemannia flammicorona]